jgi:hypothetical protein
MCSAGSYAEVMGATFACRLSAGRGDAAGSLRHHPAGRLPQEHYAELAAELAHDLGKALKAYLHWLRRDDDPARRLCDTAPRDNPGHVFFLPNDVPHLIADMIVDAVNQLPSGRPRAPDGT